MHVNDLIEQVRFHINDQRFLQTNIVDESPGEGKTAPHAAVNKWNNFSTGLAPEEFLTKNMPMVSGCKVMLKGGRWSYDFAGEFPNNYSAGSANRKFFVDYYRGLFLIPSGATPVPSGEKMRLTYSYWEDQEYRFSDNEVKSWLVDGEAYLRERIELPYKTTGRGAGLTFDVVPSGVHFSLLALTTSYFMRRRLQEEGIQDGIFIKDGDTAFDTTKTLVHRGKQLEDVKTDIDAIILDVKLGELAAAGVRIDSYSTMDFNDASAYNMERNISSASPWIAGE